MKVTTIEQARALPEVDHPYLDYIYSTDQTTGITTTSRKVRPFVPRPIDGDEILLFMDSDGRSMQVCHTAEGPAKTPWRG